MIHVAVSRVLRDSCAYHLAVTLVFVLLTVPANAQGDSVQFRATGVLGGDTVVTLPSPKDRPDLWAILQDSSAVFLFNRGRMIDRNYVASSYMFDILYDSIGTTTYLLTEWRHNQRLLRLPTWKNGRRANARASLLGYNTRTEEFTCTAGDTLSFYRELMWADPRTWFQDTNNYYALDSLDFAVELVRVSDSARIALVDSIGILPNLIPGRPRIHGTRPLMDLVRYVVPSEFDGTNAFMRLLLYHRGPGLYWFTRSDSYTKELSRRLHDSGFAYYIELFGPGSQLYKTQVLEGFSEQRVSTPHLEVIFSSAEPLRASIAFASAPDGATSVGVYDVNGRALFYPHMTPASSGLQRVEYRFPSGGNYFVALLHAGQLVATRKVSVPR